MVTGLVRPSSKEGDAEISEPSVPPITPVDPVVPLGKVGLGANRGGFTKLIDLDGDRLRHDTRERIKRSIGGSVSGWCYADRCQGHGRRSINDVRLV